MRSPQPGFTPHISTLGHGPRKALALHCTLAFSGAWGGMAKLLGDQITFTAPDMPSHGRSADWDEASDFAKTVYDASLSCLTEPMDVIGHSFGAVIALELAIERPDLVRTVTMIEPVFFHVAHTDAPDEIRDLGETNGTFIDHLKAGNRAEAARLFNRSWSDGGARWDDMPEQVRAAMTRAIHVVPDTVEFLYDDSHSMLPRLSRARMPALLIRGANSLDVVTRTNTGLANRLPNASETAIDGAGHMAPITHPKDAAALWQTLLAQA